MYKKQYTTNHCGGRNVSMSDDKLLSSEDLVEKDFEAMLNGPENLDLFAKETIQSLEDLKVNGFYKNLGDKLKKAREEVGLTLAQLGEKFGITGGAIANYEAGIRQVPIHVLIELSRILNKPIHSFLGPQAEPVISIKETLINTLERYTEAEYAKRLMELKDGKLNEVIPELLIPMPPEICKNHDITIRVKTNETGTFSYFFIKLVRPISEEQVRTLLNKEEINIKLNPDDWVLAKSSDSNVFEIVQFKNITPTTIRYSKKCNLQTYNIGGLVLARVERLVNLDV